jgi:hypothetical protein
LGWRLDWEVETGGSLTSGDSRRISNSSEIIFLSHLGVWQFGKARLRTYTDQEVFINGFVLKSNTSFHPVVNHQDPHYMALNSGRVCPVFRQPHIMLLIIRSFYPHVFFPNPNLIPKVVPCQFLPTSGWRSCEGKD